MSGASDAIAALAYAGVGAAVGSIGAAVVSARSGRGEARAHAADLISDAAGGLAAQQATTIDRLEKQTERQRRALITLTVIVDELLDQLDLPAAEKTKLRKAVTAAKLAV